jgi:hypothetical protein
MAGAYCNFCTHRCFVSRTLPASSTWRPGETVHLATCARGKQHDREGTGGFDADNTLNPITEKVGSA